MFCSNHISVHFKLTYINGFFEYPYLISPAVGDVDYTSPTIGEAQPFSLMVTSYQVSLACSILRRLLQ